MITRRESRGIALQTLFYNDFKQDKEWKDNYEYALSDFFDAKEDDGKKVERIKKDEYSFNLVKNVLEKKTLLDDIIKKAAVDWPLEKISIINRNILRIGIFELLFDKEIPTAIAANEAIILSKIFNNSEKDDQFISGVLGAVSEAAGFDDESKKRIEKEKKIKYGFLPFVEKNKKIKIALVYNIFGKWTLPKGSINQEFPNEAEAIRAIAKDKFNIEGEVLEKIGGHTYSAGIVNDKKIIKTINYFLLKVSNLDQIKLNPKLEGLTEIKFFNFDEIDGLEIYDDIKGFINNAKKILEKK